MNRSRVILLITKLKMAFLVRKSQCNFWHHFIVCYRLSRKVCIFGGLIQSEMIFVIIMEQLLRFILFFSHTFIVFLFSIVASLFQSFLCQKKMKEKDCFKKLLQDTYLYRYHIILIQSKDSCFLDQRVSLVNNLVYYRCFLTY